MELQKCVQVCISSKEEDKGFAKVGAGTESKGMPHPCTLHQPRVPGGGLRGFATPPRKARTCLTSHVYHFFITTTPL